MAGRRNKKMPKGKFLKRHAKTRAQQRYGVCLTSDDLREIVHKIQDQEARFEERRSNRVSVFRVEHNGDEFRVMYDRQRKQIATFIPLEN